MTNNNNQSFVRKITEHFKNLDFETAYNMLKNSNLPAIAILECQGNAEFYKKNYQDAFALYGQANAIDSSYRIARDCYLQASNFFAQGDLVQAFEYYQESIDIEPDFVDAYIDLGALMADIGEFSSARKCYEDALTIDPNDTNIRKSLDSLKNM